MKRLSEKLRRWARSHPNLQTLAKRYGRSYWRLPRILRSRVCLERDLSKLAGVEKLLVGKPEIIAKISSRIEREQAAAGFGYQFVIQGSRLHAPYVARFPKGWVVGQYASLVTSDGRLLLNAFRDEPRILGLERHPELEAWLETRAWRGESSLPPLEDVCPMVNRLQTNYFHWIVESCGQLESLDRYSEQTNRLPKLLIPEAAPAFLRESLTLLGFGPDRWFDWRKDSPPRTVLNAVVPSFRGTAITPSPEMTRWLRRKFLDAAGAGDVAADKVIYLPRPPGGWRSVLNEAEVIAWFRGEGHEVLQTDHLTLAEQIRLFSKAVVIVGLHGAGLTNILFAPHAGMLELTGSYGDGLYFGMTARLGQPYHALVCEPRGDDVVVDLETLKNDVSRLRRETISSSAA